MHILHPIHLSGLIITASFSSLNIAPPDRLPCSRALRTACTSSGTLMAACLLIGHYADVGKSWIKNAPLCPKEQTSSQVLHPRHFSGLINNCLPISQYLLLYIEKSIIMPRIIMDSFTIRQAAPLPALPISRLPVCLSASIRQKSGTQVYLLILLIII